MAKGIMALVVDKGQTSRKAIIKGLQDDLNAETVLEAINAQQAISLCRQVKHLDCVMVDLEIPNCNGLELVGELKKIPSAREASFIALSTNRDKSALLQAAAAGVNDYIVKPFNAGTLSNKLSKLANDPQFRRSERVSFLEAFKARICFADNTCYKASLIDLSIGGCQVRSELFNKGGGCIYDKAAITLHTNREKIKVEGILLHTERDLESNNHTTMLAGFQFLEKEENSIEKISQFIELTKNQPP